MNQIQLESPAAAAQIAARVRRLLELGEGFSALARAQRLIPDWGFVGLAALCVGAMVIVGTLGARNCRVAPIPLTLGTGTELAITMPADTPCTIRIRARSSTLDEISVEAPPRHGTLTARGRTGTVYRPNRGFKGDDAFAFTVNARSGAGRESSLIRVRASIK